MIRAFRFLVALLALSLALPAEARVLAVFWSHEFGNDFPHAFITLRGVPDAGGPPVDLTYGFTAKAVTPAILFGTVPGKLDIAKPNYIAGSDAQFSVELTDDQYARMRALATAWDSRTGDNRYNLNKRNCVHFVQAAAQIAGLTQVTFPKLMKKPRSYLKAVAAANPGRLTVIGQHGKHYLATLTPLVAAPIPAAP